jgi:hypothetical protein
MTMRKPFVVVVGIAAAALSACSSIGDRNFHGSVGGAGAPVSTVSTPSVPAYPVTITGTGEQVQTADLVAHGYTVTYQASSNCLIVEPVQSDGSDGASVVNFCGRGADPASGTTTYRGTGRTTFHISNTRGPWSLTFTPLS